MATHLFPRQISQFIHQYLWESERFMEPENVLVKAGIGLLLLKLFSPQKIEKVRWVQWPPRTRRTEGEMSATRVTLGVIEILSRLSSRLSFPLVLSFPSNKLSYSLHPPLSISLTHTNSHTFSQTHVNTNYKLHTHNRSLKTSCRLLLR